MTQHESSHRSVQTHNTQWTNYLLTTVCLQPPCTGFWWIGLKEPCLGNQDIAAKNTAPQKLAVCCQLYDKTKEFTVNLDMTAANIINRSEHIINSSVIKRKKKIIETLKRIGGKTQRCVDCLNPSPEPHAALWYFKKHLWVFRMIPSHIFFGFAHFYRLLNVGEDKSLF